MTDEKKKNLWKSEIAVCVAVGAVAFVLRTVYSQKINNNINDLSARQALMCLDIIRGSFHFPNGPWILEYDESGFAWLMAPWVFLFGCKWSVFKLFGDLLSSLTPAVLTWIGMRLFNRQTGITAGLLLATIPAQLVWDRTLLMSSIAAMSILWLMALYHVSKPEGLSYSRCALAGLLVALSSYIGHYSAIILPPIIGIILINIRKLYKKALAVAACLGAFLLGILPLLIHHANHPEYALWRERHFHPSDLSMQDLVQAYLSSLITHLRDVIIGGQECLFLRENVPVLTPIVSILVAIGFVYIVRKSMRNIFFIFGLPITLYLMMGCIKAESWSGTYHAHVMPFWTLAAALGFCWLLSPIPQRFRRPRLLVYSVLILLIMIVNVRQFFGGMYVIHPRPDNLTRMQEDLAVVEDIPILFSNRIQEVAHYHMPFWFATRSYHDRISIFGWQDGMWVSEPDKVIFQFGSGERETVGIVIRPGDFSELNRKIGRKNIIDRLALKTSGLLLVRCRVDVPDLLRRTWTKSCVPPILDVKLD